MNPNLLILLVSSLMVAGTLLLRGLNPADGTFAHTRYYLSAAMMIGGILMLISLIRLIRQAGRSPAATRRSENEPATDRRDAYRLVFDEPPRPVFLQKIDGPQSVPVFSCPVSDVSETGIRLACSGIFLTGQTVQGEIIFDSGRTVPVNGVVSRVDEGRTSLRLHCTIAPPLLMAEQRERIAMEKNAGPPPPVSRALVDEPLGSLPSHQPKGVCRLKRP